MRKSKKGDVDVKLFDSLNQSIQEYIELFAKKHGLSLDYWVADRVGEVACLGDYYVNFTDVRIDLEKKIKKKFFFDWYDLTLDLNLKGKPVVNYYHYLISKGQIALAFDK